MATGILELLGPVAAQAGTSVIGIVGGACGILLLIVVGVTLSIVYSTVWWAVGVLAGIGTLLLYSQCVHPVVFGSEATKPLNVETNLPTLAMADPMFTSSSEFQGH